MCLRLAALFGFWCGDMLLYQRAFPGFPPTDPSAWWIYALPLLALLAPGSRQGLFSAGRLMAGLGLSLIYVFLLSAPLRQYAWQDTSTAVLYIGSWGCVLIGLPLLAGAVLAPARVSAHAGIWPLVMGLMSVGSGVLFLMGSSAVYAQAAFSLAGIQGVTALLFQTCNLREHPALSTGLVWSQVWLLAMLWINVTLFASLSPVAWLAWTAFLTPLVLYLPPVTALKGFSRYLTVALVTGLCLSLAMLWVWTVQPHAEIYL